MARIPPTRYARSGGVNIAYQVSGGGPLDLLYIGGWMTHQEHDWEEPAFAHFLDRLGAFSRLIRLDRRGTGLSDRVTDPALLEQGVDDVRAVLDAVGSRRAALFGVHEAGMACALFAAGHPERTASLILYASFARHVNADDYDSGRTPEEMERTLRSIEAGWGAGGFALDRLAPSKGADPVFRTWLARYERLGLTPGSALAMAKVTAQTDIRGVLSAIRVPTLVLHRTLDHFVPVSQSRYLAERITGARLVELPGEDHLPYLGDVDALVGEVEEFLTGHRPTIEKHRVLATVLVTDIVGSTELASRKGDRDWRELLERHDALVRLQLERHRGREVNTTGDGFVAVFDGPARGLECARAIVEDVRELGLEVRAGLHTGEVELRGDDIAGIAVHIGARISSLAGPSEVLVSRTVRDLVAGSHLRFVDRGTHALKGVDEPWQVLGLAY